MYKLLFKKVLQYSRFVTALVFQLQQEEEQKIRDRAANEAALAAIGSGTKRKRLSTAGLSDGAAAVSALLMLLACPPSLVQLYIIVSAVSSVLGTCFLF